MGSPFRECRSCQQIMRCLLRNNARSCVDDSCHIGKTVVDSNLWRAPSGSVGRSANIGVHLRRSPCLLLHSHYLHTPPSPFHPECHYPTHPTSQDRNSLYLQEQPYQIAHTPFANYHLRRVSSVDYPIQRLSSQHVHRNPLHLCLLRVRWRNSCPLRRAAAVHNDSAREKRSPTLRMLQRRLLQ